MTNWKNWKEILEEVNAEEKKYAEECEEEYEEEEEEIKPGKTKIAKPYVGSEYDDLINETKTQIRKLMMKRYYYEATSPEYTTLTNRIIDNCETLRTLEESAESKAQKDLAVLQLEKSKNELKMMLPYGLVKELNELKELLDD